MLTVGLTGGIGSGKSRVSALLAAHGAVVVDADLLAREVVRPGTPGLAAVVAAFGSDVLGDDGGLDRPALARLVFPDPEALRRLNAIVHPLVAERSAAELAAAGAAGAEVVVYDVPLLVENGLAGAYDLVVVVDAAPEVALARLVAHRGLDRDEAGQRMARQAGRAERLAVADLVVDNNGTPEQLEEQVARLWRDLLSRARSA